jgi:glyoxylase-like metal-dependent hydrolase (beta-lactamase superfamily II)
VTIVRFLPLFLLAACNRLGCGTAAPIEAPTDHWRVDVVTYGWSSKLPARALHHEPVVDTPTEMAWSVAVLRRGDKVVLVDVGTDVFAGGPLPAGRPDNRSPKLWQVAWGRKLPTTLGKLGITTDQVTDVVLTHHHRDHVEGLVHFPTADVHIHRDALAALSDDVFAKGSIPSLAARVKGLKGHSKSKHTPLEGVEMALTGAHSPGHSVVTVDCGETEAILVGDAAYLLSQIRDDKPAARHLDETLHRKVLKRLRDAERDGATLVVGHDPALFDNGDLEVVTICE